MNKEKFKSKFPDACYSGKQKTFFIDDFGRYSKALNFVKHKFAKFKIVLSAVFLLLLSSCHTERMSTPFGHWDTISAVGFAWQYDINEDGQFCRSLPDVFPETSFCYNYKFSERTNIMIVQTPNVETWQWTFLAPNVADVMVTLSDSSKQHFILKHN